MKVTQVTVFLGLLPAAASIQAFATSFLEAG
jgi:hypothetical protein